ncbi:MAG: porin [Oscillatoriales cyanobacterium]|uniref:Iron uptake porin n=1 Tax=Microcoleus anatoxicus PTRS2 TaxID=2705321 RepID=A0ABU8YQY6_9CYAN|nr:MAG: porin [Oscillatoriales cyanobacterium]TAD99685.1 MAG: porin [Oscillatoriales cyanobacterium]TAF03455.1 MAG: porin [Oscillatoriales cyanobacterium]TAF41300.1 MAG: porin [Oscillatoriales cyanobacterium]TAF62841.1 MAG: porin [Oscillatoriales cyanobacterium]
MANNTNSFPVLWLSLLISGLAVPLSPIATIAQVQDNSNPELALESSSVQGISSEQTQKVVELEPSQFRGTITEIDSVVDRTLAPTQTAETVATIEPKIMGTIRELPPKELETTNFPQSQKVSEVGAVADLSSETSSADDLSIQQDSAQVTSVSQLSDVRPTDWAFGALQSLVERYGCIAGYPDGTFRGNRAMTRYEFAAGLNACLDQITKQIGTSTANLVKKEDLLAVQKLQEDFAAELATLRGRVDALEARTSELEANQFSTTTKLSGFAWFNVTGAWANDKIRVETTDQKAALPIRPAGRDPVTNRPIVQKVDNPEVTFSQLVWLTLNTSFTGKDQLITQLAVGNGNSPANQFTSAGLFNTFGTPFLDQTSGSNPNEVILRELSYRFPVTNKLQLVIGPRINFYRYFDNNKFNFFVDGASSFNSNNSTLLTATKRGAGALALWELSRQFKLGFGYLGESMEFLPSSVFNSASNPSQGLFNGTNTSTVELTFSPSDRANLRFLYSRSNIRQIGGLIGAPVGRPINGLADDGFGGKVGDATANTFSFNFDWSVSRRFGLFGRYGYGETNIFPRTNRPDGTIKTQSYQLGVAFPDLIKKGALFTMSFLVPFDVTGGRRFLVSGGGNGGTQYEIEANYYLPLTDNISIVPALYVIGNANNFDNNPTIFVGNLRTQFSF